MVLQLPAHQVAAVGDAERVRAAWPVAVPLPGDLPGGAGELGDAVVPLGDRVAGRLPVAVESGAAVALVGAGVGEAASQQPVAEDEVTGVLRARPGRAADHEPAVPVVGQPDHELGVVVPPVAHVRRRVVGEVAVHLDPGHPARVPGARRMETRPVTGVGVARQHGRRGGEVVEAGDLLHRGAGYVDARGVGAVSGSVSTGRVGTCGHGGGWRHRQGDHQRRGGEGSHAGHLGDDVGPESMGCRPTILHRGCVQSPQPIGNTSKGAANRTPSRCPARREKPSRNSRGSKCSQPNPSM